MLHTKKQSYNYKEQCLQCAIVAAFDVPQQRPADFAHALSCDS